MAEIRNRFSWSFSRHGLFETCRRKYWLNYYGSWGGWGSSAPPAVRERYIQKKLTTRPMWVGTVVHDAAERALKALRAGRRQDIEAELAAVAARARRDVEDSRAGRWRSEPARCTAFQEHYYHLDEAPWEPELQEIARQVRTLHAHPVYRRMAAVPERIAQVEELRALLVDDVPVWVKLDALLRDGRGGFVVVDWKTGRSHDDQEVGRQLGVYGLYATIELGVAPDRVQALHVNLRDGRYRTHPVNADRLEATRGLIADSAMRMRALLADVEENVAMAEDFPMLPEGHAACRTCRFRSSCDRVHAPGP